MNTNQRFCQRFFDDFQFAEGERAFIELSVEQSFHGNFVDQRFDSFGGWFGQCSAGPFNGIRDHQDGGFSRLGFGSRIAEG